MQAGNTASANTGTPHSRARHFPARCDAGLADLWDRWIEHTRGAMHINHEGTGGDLPGHMDICFDAARAQLDGALARMGSAVPPTVGRILEVGCSTGFKPFALQHRFPEAEVFGIDPDADAVALANGMAERLDPARYACVPAFRVGVGEDLPFEDSSFDLIVSLTTIEHVADVDRVLGEMARVLRPGGVLYLEAPNYLWPYEPHVGAIMPPLCPKPLLRALVRLQGNGAQAYFVDHLKFVHPHWMERRFDALGLTWRNLYLEKMRDILGGRTEAIAYRRLAGALRVMGKLHLGALLLAPFAWAGLYPSVMYAAVKPAEPGARTT
jgi:SAM-dependent methyltransferase